MPVDEMMQTRPDAAVGLSAPEYPFHPVATKAFRLLTSRPLPKITLVTAAPGYGKTVLLAHLFRTSQTSGAEALWIGLDTVDACTTRLLSLCEQALGIECKDASVAFGHSGAAETEQRVMRVLSKVSAFTGGLTIYIDNADFCNSADTEQLLDALIFRSPAYVRLVVSSTTGLQFNATRALLELRLRKIGPAELGFDVGNIEQLFSEAGIDSLTRDQVSKILEQSEGWPAAVRLMQVIASTEPAACCSAERFNQEGTQMVGALFRGVLSGLPDDRLLFLCQVAEFNQFCPELVRAATGCPDAEKHIAQLLSDNMLIIPIGGDWYRFHGLFRKFLVSYAEARIAPSDRHAILIRASQWLERSGRLAAALDLAIRADDKTVVARILDGMSRNLVRDHGDLPSLITSVQQAHSIDASLGAEARFWYVWALIFERRYETAQVELRSLEQIIAQAAALSPEMARDIQAKAVLAKIVLKLHLDDLQGVKEGAAEWVGRLSLEDEFESGAVAGAEALALLAGNEISSAKAAVRRSISAVAGSASIYGRGWAADIAAAIEIASGNPLAALDGLVDLEREIVNEVGENALIAAVTALVRARALFAIGRIEQATALAERNLPIAKNCGILEFNWLAFEVLLPAILAGSTTLTLADLKSIARAYPRRLAVLTDLRMVRLLINAGRVREAVDLACDLGVWTATGRFSEPVDSVLEMERTAARIAGISLHIASGDAKVAEEMIDREIYRTQEAGLLAIEVDLHLTHASLYQQSGNWRAALRAFGKAIGIAAERRLLQPFHEHANLVALIFNNAKTKDLGTATVAATKLLEDIQSMLGHAITKKTATDAATALGALTQRERELIRLLDSGLDNAQIAQTLSIGVPTVKWHLLNLYAKLDVKNRTAALAKARSLNLL